MNFGNYRVKCLRFFRQGRKSDLYKGPVLINRYLSEQRSEISESELFMVDELATVYRERLSDLSWFMKNLNECIARKANKEDRVRGALLGKLF